MKDIYVHASCVVAYLGPASEDSDEAVKFIAQVPSFDDELYDIETPRYDWVQGEQSFRVIYNLLERPYWHRLWIVQETIVAS